jgi:beta-glucosidase
VAWWLIRLLTQIYPRADSATLKFDDTLTASATVTNTGKRAGTEVVQFYIHAASFSGGSRPVRELKDFQKIVLQTGETRNVTFTVHPDQLGFYDAAGHWLVEPGNYQAWICKDSASGTPANFVLEK